MTVAYIECQAGASGDMFLGAWLDLGIDQKEWERIMHLLRVPGATITWGTVFKQGIRGMKVDVSTDAEQFPDLSTVEQTRDDLLTHCGHTSNREPNHDGHVHHSHPHRGLLDIEKILDESDIPAVVRSKSKLAFRHLADAEGYVHGLAPDKVHFHEVGAVDSIIDIVGAMLGWYLAGMPECYASPIEVGGGTVQCAHGLMPVPVPATTILLQGFATYSSGTWGETVTPTGAAILKTLCAARALQRPVTFTFNRVGYGAGTRELPVANLLRIQLGTTGPETPTAMTSSSDAAYVVEANIDDTTPEIIAYTTARLLERGALDVWVTPVVMKKGRPGHILHVLTTAGLRIDMEDILFSETSTIGVRNYPVSRRKLDRKVTAVMTRYGEVRLKIACDEGQSRNIAPEYEDCRALAIKNGVPLKVVYQAAYEQIPSLPNIK